MLKYTLLLTTFLLLAACQSPKDKVLITLTFGDETRKTEVKENVKALNLAGFESKTESKGVWEFECDNYFGEDLFSQVFTHKDQLQLVEVVPISKIDKHLPESYLQYIVPYISGPIKEANAAQVEKPFKHIIQHSIDSLVQSGVSLPFTIHWEDVDNDMPLFLHLISKTSSVSIGDCITSIAFEKSYDGYVCIVMTFNEEGALILQQETGRNAGRYLAMSVKGEIISVPLLNGEITGGKLMYCDLSLFDTLFGELFFGEMQSGESIKVKMKQDKLF